MPITAASGWPTLSARRPRVTALAPAASQAARVPPPLSINRPRTRPLAAPARDDLQQVRERRLAAVPAEELPLGGEAPDEELPLGSSSGSSTGPSLESGYEAAAYDVDQALDLAVPEVPEVHDEPIRATADEPVTEASRAAEAERAKHRRPVQKKRGRASVPSWDEIMFGGGDQ